MVLCCSQELKHAQIRPKYGKKFITPTHAVNNSRSTRPANLKMVATDYTLTKGMSITGTRSTGSPVC